MSRLHLTLAIALVAGACTPPTTDTAGTTTTAAAPAGAGMVTRVHDGDTIDVETPDGIIDVRLAGINAPDQGECFQAEATGHLTETLQGREVTLEIVGEDQFDRALAWVDEAGRDVSLELVTLGLALATTPEEPGEMSLIEAEEGAYRSGTGLWSPDACGTGVPAEAEVEVDGEASSFDPSGPDDEVLAEEMVVLVNAGDDPVDMGGWVIRDESSRHRYRFAEGVVLAPGGSMTIRSTDPGWVPGGSPVWSNGGDMVLVLDETGRVVARHRY